MEGFLNSLYSLFLQAQYLFLSGTTNSLEGAVDKIKYDENANGFSQLASDVGDISTGIYTIAAKIGIACGVIGVVVVGIMFIYNSGGQGRQENKGRLVNTILGIIFVACAIGLVAALVKLGGGLFASTSSGT